MQTSGWATIQQVIDREYENLFYMSKDLQVVDVHRQINNKINKFNFKACYVFHPSLRYLFIAKFSNIREIWGLGFKFQNFFLEKNKKLYLSLFAKTKGDNEALEFVKKITNASKIPYEV